ncbi:cadmium resistance transporter [Lentzea aerocolonigenes]|uniref:cadmium resistance transporter n=1 Tax=Lentzea aerocolonigenes TaxID=68170 RepID=UPI0004C3B0D2|nr:cadmium resistance transporter [Lentzea aerocolonigenes]MCP2244445.1 Cadmium resistance protein CadD, predicted permease [Lentzea aerocolonigenes]
MDLGVIGQAAGMFAVTNVDDLVLLALFFARAHRPAQVVLGQYLGFARILAVAVVGALGASLLPEQFRPWLGLIPLALGLKAAWSLWRNSDDDDEPDAAPGVLAVAGVTLANGGDNIGVYVPVFTVADSLWVYVAVFLILVGVWCLAGWFLASRRPVAQALARWGHIALPVVLIAIGLLVLFSG